MTAIYKIRDRYIIPGKGIAYSIEPNSKTLMLQDVVYDLQGNQFIVTEMVVSRIHMAGFYLMDDFDYILESQNGAQVQGDILVDDPEMITELAKWKKMSRDDESEEE